MMNPASISIADVSIYRLYSRAIRMEDARDEVTEPGRGTRPIWSN